MGMYWNSDHPLTLQINYPRPSHRLHKSVSSNDDARRLCRKATHCYLRRVCWVAGRILRRSARVSEMVSLSPGSVNDWSQWSLRWGPQLWILSSQLLIAPDPVLSAPMLSLLIQQSLKLITPGHIAYALLVVTSSFRYVQSSCQYTICA
ncbi:hypothetical protein BC834DRAFT_592866 [Gloeopeniophorella convolvens]|nr:hypothetical protein BC834DRAFT_592866 [Gloeopeniophorella convolvens]